MRECLEQSRTLSDVCMPLGDVILGALDGVDYIRFLGEGLPAAAMENALFFICHDKPSLYPTRTVRKEKWHDCTQC